MYLNIPNIRPGPEGLKDKVGEAQDSKVFNKLLPQVMINPAG